MGWVHSSRPWVLHSRRSWQERRGKVGGGVGGGFGVVKSLGTFSFYWLVGCQSHHDYHTRPGQIHRATIHPLSLSSFFFLFFLLLSRMAKVRSLIISPTLSSHLVQSVYFFASPFNHCRDWERSFTVHVLHTNTRSKFFISVLFFVDFVFLSFSQSRLFCPLQFSSVPEQQWTSKMISSLFSAFVNNPEYYILPWLCLPPPSFPCLLTLTVYTSVAMTHSLLSSAITNTDWYMESLEEHIVDILHSGFSLYTLLKGVLSSKPLS